MLTLIALSGLYQIYRKTTGRELPIVVSTLEKLKATASQYTFFRKSSPTLCKEQG
ncbi:MAG: hypothetical protein AAGI49_00190 [Bacteroidota bacterium]